MAATSEAVKRKEDSFMVNRFGLVVEVKKE